MTLGFSSWIHMPNQERGSHVRYADADELSAILRRPVCEWSDDGIAANDDGPTEMDRQRVSGRRRLSTDPPENPHGESHMT